MIKFSVTRNGRLLDMCEYNWDVNTKTFSSDICGLVLDFTNINGVTFKTGYNCTFKTGSACTFKTGSACTFNTGYGCTFNTGYDCTFNTGFACKFKTGSNCTFKTGYDCTFKTGFACTFKTGDNCFVTRYDVKGVTEIPVDKTIKLNEYEIQGYTIVEEKEESTCNGKIVEIDGKKYKLTKI